MVTHIAVVPATMAAATTAQIEVEAHNHHVHQDQPTTAGVMVGTMGVPKITLFFIMIMGMIDKTIIMGYMLQIQMAVMVELKFINI